MRALNFKLQRFATITGTAGDDKLKNSAVNAVVYGNGGNDSIYNSGRAATLIGGDGRDTIKNAADGAYINSGNGDDSIYSGNNYYYGVKIDAGGGNDTIDGLYDRSTINGGDGNDSIYAGGIYSTIDGGAGDDTIYADDLSSVNGGSGNDYIYTYYDVTVKGGTGDDTIQAEVKNEHRLYQYASGDGNDVIIGFGPNDTLHITKGSFTTLKSGNDFVVSVDGGTITLKDVLADKYHRINLKDASGNISIYNNWSVMNGTANADSFYNAADSVTVAGLKGNDTINNNGKYVEIFGNEGNDSIYNGWGTHYTTINGGGGDDTISNYAYNVKILGGDGNDYIYNSSYGTTIDGGNGSDTISADNNELINGGAGDDVISVSGYSNSISGGAGNDTVYISSSNNPNHQHQIRYASGDGNDVVYGITDSDTVMIVAESFTTTKSGADVIVKAGAGSITLKNSAGTKLNINALLKNATSGDDRFANYVNYATINALEGDDAIINYNSYVSINGGDGNDSITNTFNAHYNTIDGGSGEDTIYSESSATISGGDGDDSIRADYGGSINGGAGNDTIRVDGYYYRTATVTGGAGADAIYLGGRYGVLYQYASGDGNDTIYNFSSNDTLNITGGRYSTTKSGNDFIVNVGAGSVLLKDAVKDYNKIRLMDANGNISIYNDWTRRTISSDTKVFSNYVPDVRISAYHSGNGIQIFNHGEAVTIEGSKGKDDIYNANDSVKIYSYEGNDTIENNGNYVSINGGDGNDSIVSYNDYGAINGGGGNDKISLSGYSANNTISGGRGNDTIYGRNAYDGNVYLYESGDGSDVMVGLSSRDTLKITGNVYSTVVSGSDLVVKVGDGAITLKSGKNSNVNIQGMYDQGNKIIRNTTNNTLLSGSAASDTISNIANNVTIRSGDGDDSILNDIYDFYTLKSAYGHVTIDAGNGNDRIVNYAPDVSISAGNGDDVIVLDGRNTYVYIPSTIHPEDTYIGSEHVTVNAGKGNDTIKNWESSYSLYQYALGDGNDVITDINENDTISIGGADYSASVVDSDVVLKIGTGAITLKGARNKYFNLKKDNAPVIYTVFGDGATLDNSIKGASLTGTAHADSIKNTASRAVIDAGEGDDMIYNTGDSVKISGGDGADSIDNSGSTVTIDAGKGNDTIKVGGGNKGRISIDGGSGDDVISLSSSSKFGRNTVRGGTGNDKIYSNGTTTEGNVYLYTAGDGHDTIYNVSARDTISISGASGTRLVSGSDILFSVGSGSILVKNPKSKNFAVKGTIEVDPARNIENLYQESTVITGSAKNDTIYNSARKVQISTGGGADTIVNAKAPHPPYRYAGDYSSINSGDGNDYIFNEGTYVKIYAGDGADTIHNEGDRVSIDAGAGDDFISIEGGGAEITGGKGNDTVDLNKSGGNLYKYATGDGDDLIFGFGSTDTLHITKGAFKTSTVGTDLIVSIGAGSVVLKDAFADPYDKIHIKNAAGAVSVINDWKVRHGTDDADTINNIHAGVSIYAEGGDDAIYNYYVSATLDGGEGNDIIRNYSSSVVAYGGAGADTIYNSGSYTRIDAGAGDDSIVNNYTRSVSINGGAGDDSISLASSIYDGGNTIRGGTGNDVVYLNSTTTLGNVYQYNGGDGADTIYGITKYDTILVGGAYKVSSSGSDVIVSVSGGGTMTLKNTKNNSFNIKEVAPEETPAEGKSINNTVDSVTLTGTAGNDSINNKGSNVKAYGGAGNDTFTGIYFNSFVDAGDGDDLITITGGVGGSGSTFDGGAGDDTIVTSIFGSINGGAGNDLISLNTYDSYTVRGGTGNDTIYGEHDFLRRRVYQYAPGDGNDVIYGFAAKDTLQIAGGKYSTQLSGNDVVVKVGSESITLKDAKGTKVIIKDTIAASATVGVELSTERNGEILNGSNGYDVLINDFAKNTTLNGGKGNDTLANQYDSLASGVVLNGGDGDDGIDNYGKNATLNGGTGDDSIYNNHTGVYTYIDAGAGDDLVDNAANYVTIKGGSGNDIVFNASSKVSISGGAGNDFIEIYEGSNNTVNGGEGNDTLGNGGDSVTMDGGSGNDIISNAGSKVSISGGTGNDFIEIYGGSNNTVNGGEGNDTITLDSNYSSKTLIQYKTGDGNDFIDGITSKDTLQIDGSYSTVASGEEDVVVKVGSSKITLKYAQGDMPVIKTTGTGTASADRLNNTTSGVVINALGGNDTITNSASNVTINGGMGNDVVSLTGGSSKNFLQFKTGDGNDTVYGFGANDTIHITGGSISSSVVSDNDGVINIGGGSITLKDIVGTEFNIKVGNGAVSKMKFEPLPVLPDGWRYNNFNRTAVFAVSAAPENLDLREDYGEGVKVVHASRAGAGVEIIGNDLGNSIDGGKGDDTIIGGKGNDTLRGNSGNDVFIYTGGDDLIHDYQQGKDTIQIGADISIEDIQTFNNHLLFTTDVGEMTVKYAAKQDVVVVDEDGNRRYPVVEEVTLPSGWRYIDANNTKIEATLANAGELDLTEPYGAGVSTVDASQTSGGIKITGNDLSVSIRGGRGADTIITGTGDDTVSMGGGNDLYIYHGGDDYIWDYKNQNGEQDSIKVAIDNAKITLVQTVSADVVFTVNDSAQFTVKNGKSKEILIFDAKDNAVSLSPELPDGWKYNPAKTRIIANVSTAEDVDLRESYGDGVTTVEGGKAASGISIIGNDLNNSLKGGNGSDTIQGGTGSDTLTGGNDDDIFIYTGGDDVITDYGKVGKDTIVADMYSAKVTAVENLKSDVLFTINDNGTILVKNGKDKAILIVDAENNTIYPFTNPLPDGWRYGVDNTRVIATLKSAENIDLTEDYGADITIVDASAVTSGVVVTCNDLGVSVNGGNGNSVIEGGEGNDTVSLGRGNDLYIYSGGGEDLIQNYAAGNDTIQIDTDNIEFLSADKSGANLVVSTDAGNITIKDGANKSVLIVDKDNETLYPVETLPDGWECNANKNMISAASTKAADLDLTESYGEGVHVVNATKALNDLKITANDLGVSLKSGRGNDTITGGAGNDTLTGSSGYDLFVYTGGDDVIMDYAAGQDVIKFATNHLEVTGVATVNSSVVYTTDQGTLTVRNGRSKNITAIDSNGWDLVISASSADLFEDDNFLGNDARLDEISAVDFSVTNLQPSKVEPFAQEQPLITFNKDK